MAGTVAIVAALAVTTLVLLTGDDATSALAAKVATAVAPVVAAPAAAAVAASKVAAVATAPKVAMAAAPKAPIVAKAAAPRKVAVAGKGTSKMSDNWKVNEDVPDSPTYSDLEREVQELQKAEKKHFNTRAASLTNAMTSATKDGNKPGLKGLKWKNSKDKYEQAAYKDIMDEEKERIKDSITEEGAEMFQHYEKKAQSLMGTDDLKKLQNSTEIAEKMRSMREKSALIALKSANAALNKVEVAQDEAREQEDRKKQMRANAKMAAHLQSAVAASRAASSTTKRSRLPRSSTQSAWQHRKSLSTPTEMTTRLSRPVTPQHSTRIMRTLLTTRTIWRPGLLRTSAMLPSPRRSSSSRIRCSRIGRCAQSC